MLILGIETSCDETAVAVVENGRRVLANRIASQIPLHQRYGGVVPEIASRAHLEAIIPTMEGALGQAGVSLDAMDAIAVTRGPGLIGCLLIGMETGKAIALSRGKPFLPVNHIAGHILSPFLGTTTDAWGDSLEGFIEDWFQPYVAMVLSGGHSSVVHVEAPLSYRILGETLDDAVGEAYDKVGKLLGLGYPGGPVMDRLATDGDPKAFDFPRPLLDRPGMDFSFSGLKTAVARMAEKLGGAEVIARDPALLANLCASFQAAAIDSVLHRAERALEQTGLDRLALTGGVSSNRGLRAAAARRLRGIQIAIPTPEYCTDNAAMIAAAGSLLLARGVDSPVLLNARSDLPLEGAPAAWLAS